MSPRVAPGTACPPRWLARSRWSSLWSAPAAHSHAPPGSSADTRSETLCRSRSQSRQSVEMIARLVLRTVWSLDRAWSSNYLHEGGRWGVGALKTGSVRVLKKWLWLLRIDWPKAISKYASRSLWFCFSFFRCRCLRICYLCWHSKLGYQLVGVYNCYSRLRTRGWLSRSWFTVRNSIHCSLSCCC